MTEDACNHQFYSNHRVEGTDRIITVCRDKCKQTLRIIDVGSLGPVTNDLWLDHVIDRKTHEMIRPCTEEDV